MTDIDPPLLPKRTLPIFPSPASYIRTGHGSFVFSCSADSHKLCLHDVVSGESIISLDAPTDNPSLISVSSDAEKAAFATNTGAVYIWDAMYPTSMESFRPDEEAVCDITAIAWHPRGHVLAVAASSGHLYLWDFVVGTLLYPVPAHEGPISDVKWTANGRLVVTVGTDNTLRVWNPRNVDQVGEISADSEEKNAVKWHSSSIRCMDTLSDLSRVAITGADDGSVLLSVLKPESMCGVFHAMQSHKSAVSSVAFAPLHSPKPLRAASGAADGSINLFDMDRRLPMGSFNQSHKITQLTFKHTADALFSAAGPTVVMWDARVAPEEERPITFGGHEEQVSGFALTDNDVGLVTACHDGTLRVYDVRYPSEEVPPVDALLNAKGLTQTTVPVAQRSQNTTVATEKTTQTPST